MYNITDLNLQIASKHPVVTYLHIYTYLHRLRHAGEPRFLACCTSTVASVTGEGLSNYVEDF